MSLKSQFRNNTEQEVHPFSPVMDRALLTLYKATIVPRSKSVIPLETVLMSL